MVVDRQLLWLPHYDDDDNNNSVNVPATGKSSGRTPLHYACRNGALTTAQYLVNELGADVNARAKHGVTPFQLAIWRNQLEICQWLVHQCGVDPAQVNDFGCGAVHWLGISPVECADGVDGENDDHDNPARIRAGKALIQTAQWLAKQPGVDFQAKQNTGHTALHKAAWLGHTALCEYLHLHHDMWDDSADHAGNYAADLADMANTPRHTVAAEFLRQFCSRQKATSCAILGVPVTADESTIRAAYKQKVRLVHPDKQQHCTSDSTDFLNLQRAYNHLLLEKGKGSQSNPAHSLKLMIQVSGPSDSSEVQAQEADNNHDGFFKARLIAVLLEYGDKGLDLSNLRKKWKQVWPTAIFPYSKATQKSALSDWVRHTAGDVVDMRKDEKGCWRLYPKHCSRATVATAAEALLMSSVTTSWSP